LSLHPPHTVLNPEVERDQPGVFHTRRAGNGTSEVALPTRCVSCAIYGQTTQAVSGGQLCRTHLNNPDYVPRGRAAHAVPTDATDATLATALLTGVGSGGQIRLQVPLVPRARHATGIQEWCVRCERRGIARRGMPRVHGSDGEPLCLSCWPAWRGRRAHLRDRHVDQLLAGGYQRWELQELGLAEADVDEDPDDAGVCCPACEQLQASPDCWLCGYTWLRRVQQDHEAEQAALAAATEAEFTRIAAITEIELRVSWLEGVLKRAQAAIEAYAVGGSRGRPIELLADLMARHAAARTTLRGRPGALVQVAAVMALDSDWRSGKRSMFGRRETALVAGCSTRAVTDAWALAVALEWAERTVLGGKLSKEERMELGRSNNRSVYDLVQLHTSTVDPDVRAAWVPLALDAYADLCATIADLISAAYDDLDGLHAHSGARPDPAAMVHRARLRQAADAAMAAAVTAVDRAATTADHRMNFFPPRLASNGECFSSLSLGVEETTGLSSPATAPDGAVAGRPDGRRKCGASRSSTGDGVVDLRSGRSQPVEQPKPLQAQRPASPRPRRRPKWLGWATDLYEELIGLWPWLLGSPQPMVVAALGAALGPAWSALDLVKWVERVRSRPLPDRIENPAAYLKALLREVLIGLPDLPDLPHPARLATEHKKTQAQELREHQDQVRAERAAEAELAAAGGRRGASARDRIRAITAQAAGHADRHRPLKPWSARRPGAAAPAAPAEQAPAAVDVAPPVLLVCTTSAVVAWHGCSGTVAVYQEPWAGGREVAYCEACAASVVPAWGGDGR
jgi:hypothetical protein